MENIKIRCKSCNKEIEGDSARVITCGCPNASAIRYNNKITALDLSYIVMLSYSKVKKDSGVLTNDDIMWQEERRQRKVRRLDFEVR